MFEKTASEAGDGAICRLLHCGKVHEGGVGVKFVLDCPAAEDALKGSIKENFDEHSRIVGVLTGGSAIRSIEVTQIQLVDDRADNPCVLVRRAELIEGEGKQQGLFLVIGFEADISNHDNIAEALFWGSLPV